MLCNFLICRLVEGFWNVDDGWNGSSSFSPFGGANAGPQRISSREGTANHVTWQIDDVVRLAHFLLGRLADMLVAAVVDLLIE